MAVLDASISAAAGLFTVAIVQYVNSRRLKNKKEVDNSRVVLDERIALDVEARKLRAEMREQLQTCHTENQRLEKALNSLQRRVASLEAELWEWRSGRRTVENPGLRPDDYPRTRPDSD